MPPDVAPTGAAPPERGEAPLLYEMSRDSGLSSYVLPVVSMCQAANRVECATGRSRMESGRLDLPRRQRRPHAGHGRPAPPGVSSVRRPWPGPGSRLDPGALACNVSGPGTIPPPASVSPPWKRP